MKTFEELDLVAPVQSALVSEKYHHPTPIQAKTIPPALMGRDILGCAQTGTGKTAAFALPLLNHLAKQNRAAIRNSPFALVLAPTRELAIQIGQSCERYGKNLHLRHALVYGGVSQNNQVRVLNRGAHCVVATPGRLLDLMNQGYVHLDRLELFVLDEADRMLDMGFLPDIKRIISKLPRKRQSLFFSATMPPKITELSNQLLTNPTRIHVAPESTSADNVEQQVLFVHRDDKKDILRDILTAPEVDRALVFTRTKRGANMLADRLVRSGIKATAIHGNKSQSARQRALAAFQNKQVSVLVATDVAARGIDIDGITHVINFDLPNEPESYVHRIGRTGRAGASGIAISFCTSEERNDLRAIEKLLGQRIPMAKSSLSSGQAPTRSEDEENDSPRRKPSSGRKPNRKPQSTRKPHARRAASPNAAPQRPEFGATRAPLGDDNSGPQTAAKPKRRRVVTPTGASLALQPAVLNTDSQGDQERSELRNTETSTSKPRRRRPRRNGGVRKKQTS